MGSINYSYLKTHTGVRIMKSFYFSENCQEFSEDFLELATVFFSVLYFTLFYKTCYF